MTEDPGPPSKRFHILCLVCLPKHLFSKQKKSFSSYVKLHTIPTHFMSSAQAIKGSHSGDKIYSFEKWFVKIEFLI